MKYWMLWKVKNYIYIEINLFFTFPVSLVIVAMAHVHKIHKILCTCIIEKFSVVFGFSALFTDVNIQ